mgnify:CR=1 FL=1
MKEKAQVSFIVPCYNQGKYLSVALESIYQQDFTDWEIIIINDGSTDDSQEIIKTLMAKAPTKNIYCLCLNDVGSSVSRNTAIRMATGDFYVPLDADDKIDKTFLGKTLNKFNVNKSYGFVYVDTLYVVGNNYHPNPSPEYSFMGLLMNNFMSYCSLFRKDAYMDVGGYDLDNFCYYEDYELYIKLGMKGWYGIHLPENLFYYNVHADSSMQTERARKLGGVYKAYMINKYSELFPLEWQEQAKKIMEGFPKDFMSWKPQRQEEYAKKI